MLAGGGFLVACTLAAFAGEPRSTVVAFGLYGFVLHTVFGKAYGLLPAYFDRDLAVPRAPLLQLPFSAVGAFCLAVTPGSTAADRLPVDPAAAGDLGAILWALGATVFLATIAVTIRDNPTGAETGTSEAKADRARLDRVANAAMPFALGYLALATYAIFATVDAAPVASALPTPIESTIAISHLLAVGTAALLVFAIGARLLPRLLRAETPDALATVVLVAGVLGPALLVAWFDPGIGGRSANGVLHGAIALLAIAVLGHAALVGVLVRRAPAPRLGVYGVLAGAIGGVLTVGAGGLLGLGRYPELYGVHPRLGVLGFLGLTIVGVVYHFYPPAVAGEYGDDVAAASLLLLGGGLALELIGVLAGNGQPGSLASLAIDGGRGLAVLGALAYAGLLFAIVYHRYR
ncbi:hypothetical protein GCM10028857_11540 [Salinarchaeum chitinilyticum]